MNRKSVSGRAAVLAVSGVVAAGVLAGCGSGAGSTSSGPSAAASSSAPPAGGGGQEAGAVQAAYQKTSDAKTAKMAITTMVQGSGTDQLTAHGSGVIDLAKGGTDVTMAVQGQQIEERTLDGILYEKLPAATAKEQLPSGKTWLKIDLKKVAAQTTGGSAASSQMTDPAAPFGYTKGLSGKDVTKVGTETVDGVKTTHYSVSVDVAELAQGDSAQAQQLRKQLGSKLPIDLWLDDQGRIRQEEVKISVKPASDRQSGGSADSASPSSSPQQLTVETKLQFSDFGTQVDVSAPPASATADLTGKLTQGGTQGAVSE